MNALKRMAIVAFLTLGPLLATAEGVSERYVYCGSGNPYLPLWEHLPDGEPRVFEDPDMPGKFRVYIVGSHDTKGTEYCGYDVHAWSAPTDDLTSWRDEGAIFSYRNKKGKWDIMYAPDLVEVPRRDGSKEYFLYPHSRGEGRLAMVARSNRPDGPFEPVNLDRRGKALDGSVFGFDPSVYVERIDDPKDPDYTTGYRVYGYWGFRHSSAAEIDPATMYSVRPGSQTIEFFIPAGDGYGKLLHPDESYPALARGVDPKEFNFFEASSIRKAGNKYILIYSGYSGPEYGLSSSNSTLRYAYADSPLGPWVPGGVLVDSRAPHSDPDGSRMLTTNGGHNTHGSLEKIGNLWYVFYHRPPRNHGYARQGMVAPVRVVADSKPVSKGGKVSITGFDPFSADNILTVRLADGIEYTGAEVTSEGFQIYGLPPYAYYPSGIACYLSDTGLQQDSWDVWDVNAPVVGMRSGDTVGYKYFGFGGLDSDKDGLHAFEGTRVGNGTSIDLFLEPLSDSSFSMEVWIDAPGEGKLLKGRKIAEIPVSGYAAGSIAHVKADVASAVEGLEGKHSIYLVARAAGNEPVVSLHGLGFSRDGLEIAKPRVPKVAISVDGKAVQIPSRPSQPTEKTGYFDFSNYDISSPVAPTCTVVPTVSASCDCDDVDVKVVQSSALSSPAVVKCTYNGLTKTFRLNFNK